ncbi:MAG TPA: M14 family metallopeptidase [Panacibacter sp.]|nr:M14 family metallopeptidase [Panacibacter sp.]HNP44288.1 M14 family metallopeptidase [Panacibacter sp.]
MKKLIFPLLLLALSFFCSAQQQQYCRVKIYTGPGGLQTLIHKGVAIDHGYNDNNKTFITEISLKESAILKSSGLKYDVLINDMAAYYVAGNAKAVFDDGSQVVQVDCGTYPKPKNFSSGSMGGYYTYSELLAILDSMTKKFPKLISAKKIVSANYTTTEGRPLYYVKISDNPAKTENEPKILYTALHHAREPESMAQLIYFMWYLLENYKKDTTVRNIVDSTEMYFIPCVNPDGYVYNETTNPNGGGYWRKNRRNNNDGSYGVDLNRNYGYEWGYDDMGSSPYTSSDTYRGPSAFSEPETKMIKEFCDNIKFTYALNNHSYGNYLIYPYGYGTKTYTPDSILYKQQANRLVQCNEFTKGTTIQTVGYTANGGSDDWMYGEQTEKSKIIAYTAETGTAYDGFWPKKSKIIPLAAANLDMNLNLALLTKQSVYARSKIASSTNAMQPTIAAGTLYNSPNPCNNFTRVYFNLPQQLQMANAMLIISNAGGQPVLSQKVAGESNAFVNTTAFTAGIYYYFIKAGSYQSETKKLIVVK